MKSEGALSTSESEVITIHSQPPLIALFLKHGLDWRCFNALCIICKLQWCFVTDINLYLICHWALSHAISAVQISGLDFIESGTEITLTCTAVGKPDPPHDVIWYKDNTQIQSNVADGIIITKKIEPTKLVSMLVVQKSRIEDQGEYTCESSEKDRARFTVHIISGEYDNG